MIFKTKTFIDKTILYSFGVAILFLAYISITTYIGLHHVKDSAALAEHSYEVMSGLQKIPEDLKDVERGVRGYLLIKDPGFLTTFQLGKKLVLADMAYVELLTEDNPFQQNNLDELKPIIEEKLKIADTSIIYSQSGQTAELLSLQKKGRGTKLMTSVQKKIAEMKSHELNLLQKRKSAQEKNIDVESLIIIAGSLISILFSGIAAYTINHQIWERQAASQKLAANEERLRSLLDSANDSFITTDEKGIIVEINPATETLFGYTKSELLGQPMSLLMPKRFTEQSGNKPFEKFLEMAHSSSGFNLVELFGRKKDQTEFPVEISVASWKARDIQFYTTLSRDITERKFFTKMLLKNEHRLFQFLEAIPVGIFVTNQDGKPYYANQAAKELLGKSVDPKATPERLSEVYNAYLADSDQLYPMEKMPILRALSGEKSVIEDMEIHHHNKIVPVQVWGVPILDEVNKVKYSVAVFLDITERRQNMKALQEREEFFRTLFDESPMGMILAFPDSTLVNVNRSFCTMLGYSKNDLIGHSYLDFNHPMDANIEKSLAKKLFDKILPQYQMEKRQMTKNGQELWCKTFTSVIRDANDEPLFSLSIIENITEQKEAETALKESEEKFRRVFEENPLGMIFVNPAGIIQDSNKAFGDMLGYSRKELTNFNVYNATHPDDHDISKTIPLNDSGNSQIEKRYITKEGKTIWANVTPLAMKENEKTIRVLSIVENITRRKEAEMAIRESEEQFRLILDSAGDGIYGIDIHGNCTFCNPAALKLLGYKNQQEIMEKNMHALIHHTHKDGRPYPSSECPIYKAVTEGKSYQAEDELFWTSHQTAFPVEYHSYPIYRYGKIAGAVVTFSDITQRKQIDEMKRDLISVVSHQLKTPVAEINGYIENMLEGLAGELTRKQREYLVDMKEIGMENYRLISDLLSMSKIERGVITVEIKTVSLRQIIESSIRDYETAIQRKKLDLILEYPSQMLMVASDKDKTVETIRNIINNAIKCTDKGSIMIRTREEDNFVFVDITDTGIGMSSESLKRLFTKERVMGAEAGRAGAGLGLFIARSFMQLQNGDISVVSEQGKGSTFSVKIPKAVSTRSQNV